MQASRTGGEIPRRVGYHGTMPLELDSPDRRSAAVVAVATLVGLALRVWPIARLGLNQFDEGIYAMAAGLAASGGPARLDPGLIPYAPPGYPLLVALCSWAFGVSDQPSFLVSAALGATTIPVAAALARRLSGPRAAAVAAVVTCCSGPHIAFSRSGLTDSSFLFFWTVGLVAGIRFLEQPGAGRGLVMGGLIGLAQEFKYNGWLLGGFIVAAAILGEARGRMTGARPGWPRLALWGGLGALIAALIVAPWYLFVERHGGYAGLLRHQRSYLGGWDAWWPHLVSQARQAVALGGPAGLGIVATVGGGLACWWVDHGRGRGEHPGAAAAGVGLAMMALWPLLTAPVVTGFLLIVGRPWARDAASRLVAVAWLGLLVLSPFYHPYARLWLPFEFFHWIALGGIASQLAELPQRWGAIPNGRARAAGLLGLVGLLLVGILGVGAGFPLVGSGRAGHAGLFGPSDALRLVAAEVAELVPADGTRLRTLIRPAMSYYLGGRCAIAPAADLAQLEVAREPLEWGLIDSTILARPPRPRAEAGRAEPPPSILVRWEVVATIPAELTLPTALDLEPDALPPTEGTPCSTFWLVRPRRFERAP